MGVVVEGNKESQRPAAGQRQCEGWQSGVRQDSQWWEGGAWGQSPMWECDEEGVHARRDDWRVGHGGGWEGGEGG